MKTLVIHPEDRTTDFLNIIYKDRDWTVINDRIPCDKRLRSEMVQHDRIIMMGHGCPSGLFGGETGLLINKTHVDILKQKHGVYIWCNADVFVRRYELNGFYTGMFISEVMEARMFDIKTTQKEIDYSNNLFVENMKGIMDTSTILTEIKSKYVGDCPVIQFNNSRLYYNI